MNANAQIIDPSTFNRRITVKRSVATIDSAGGVENSFTDRFETWASVDSLNTGRKVYYGFDTFDSVYEIKLRYNANRLFTTADVIEYEGVIMNVTSAQLVRQSYKTFNILLAKEVNPQG